MARTSPPNPSASVPSTAWDAGLGSTRELLDRARRGEASAMDALVTRYLSPLRRFAHGRVPPRARNLLDTDDLVQSTILRALGHVHSFEPQRPGSFLAYLRQILINHVRDQARRVARSPREDTLSEDIPAPGLGPIENAIGHENAARYEQALAKLPPDCQEAIVLRLEMGCSYAEIAEAQGRPSANAARLYTTRALLKLVELLRSSEGRV